MSTYRKNAQEAPRVVFETQLPLAAVVAKQGVPLAGCRERQAATLLTGAAAQEPERLPDVYRKSNLVFAADACPSVLLHDLVIQKVVLPLQSDVLEPEELAAAYSALQLVFAALQHWYVACSDRRSDAS